jgi:hypothetical protein
MITITSVGLPEGRIRSRGVEPKVAVAQCAYWLTTGDLTGWSRENCMVSITTTENERTIMNLFTGDLADMVPVLCFVEAYADLADARVRLALHLASHGELDPQVMSGPYEVLAKGLCDALAPQPQPTSA